MKLDVASGLHNCLEFSQHPFVFITGYENTENVFCCLIAIDVKSTELFEFSDGMKFEAVITGLVG